MQNWPVSSTSGVIREHASEDVAQDARIWRETQPAAREGGNWLAAESELTAEHARMLGRNKCGAAAEFTQEES